MKNLVVKKLIVLPYALVSLSMASNIAYPDICKEDAFTIASGVHVSNLEVQNNRSKMTFVYNNKKKIKSIF